MKSLINYSELTDFETLNNLIGEGKANEVVAVCEQYQEDEIDLIYNEIKNRNIPIVMVTGPTSSGKTTFASRLSNKFEVPPLVLSIDDLFYGNDEVDKTNVPADYFESIAAVNVDLFNQCVYSLMGKKKTAIPYYDFKLGRSIKENRFAVLQDGQEIIVEGIHAFNETLLPEIKPWNKYGIFIHFGTDVEAAGELISKRDMRLVRRTIRDKLFRGCDVERTQQLWKGVISFEQDNILPFESRASRVFNSYLPYEPAITGRLLRKFLDEVGESEDLVHIRNIAKKLECFRFVDRALVPPNSILKEFIGDF